MNKKLILSISIIVILLNALLPHYTYADTTTETASGTTIKTDSLQAREKIERENAADIMKTPIKALFNEDGLIKSVGEKEQKEAGDSIGLVVKTCLKIALAIPYAVQAFMTIITVGDGSDIYKGTTIGDVFDASKYDWFTIEKAVFGKIALFNVDFFELNTEDSSANTALKKSVVSIYQVTFKLAQILNILVLIYVGIRMVISSTMESKAKYKKMFKDWLIGFAMLFVLHYVMILILKLVNWFTSLIPTSLLDKNMERQIMNVTIEETDIWNSKTSVWAVLQYAIAYIIIVSYQTYFFYKYFTRLLTMAFLIIIGPLITSTYAIDKLDNNKKTALASWSNMFIKNAFMQPVHALMYAIFIFSASAIALKVPLLAIVFFMGILKAESMFNKLFNLG